MSGSAVLSDNSIRLFPQAEPTTQIGWRGVWLPTDVFDAREGIEDDAREGIERKIPERDATSYSDDAATIRSAEHAATIQKLRQLLLRFQNEGFSFSGPNDESRITVASRFAAERLLNLLPTEYQLPRIAPDDEGGVILAWPDVGGQSVLITMDGWTLHLVNAPARNAADYLDDLPFDGETLVEPIRNRIPKL